MLNEPNYAAGKFLSEHSNILFKESAYYQKALIRQSERGRPEYTNRKSTFALSLFDRVTDEGE